MRALLCEHHGPPEELHFADVPVPEPKAGEVRFRVKAASVNFPDALMIQNLYQRQPPLPFIPGSEAAGIIDALGEGVSGLRIGDRIATIPFEGAFAEFAIAPAFRTAVIPEGMGFDVAAGFTMVYATALHGLRQRGRLQPGETLLVLGAAGGVGLAAVEVGKRMGAHVIAAASTEEKLALARAHGADETVNYAQDDLKQAVKALTGERGVDVIFDPVGGALAEPAFRTMGWDGRYLVVGFAAGTIPAIPLNLPLVKTAAIIGVTWGVHSRVEPDIHAENMAQLYRWYEEGGLRPEVSKRFSFEESREAIRWMMDRKVQGKIVIELAS
ncbi:NADPH:quinone oxidoreductase family protein [Sphingobium sp. SA916]|uniref:NADPH:quinone oxidoreductase family protein n=1 Tax=Sphingobium sp. SA916 TaxID=1851207 RepID=UPI000CB93B6D|nr:NADPH:quinone oxidoreductase family protein [Sphingobium sp. SA916]PNP98161.1 NADPH:quinone oxidoreductase [Sphingobium sp. SA916]